MKKVLFSLKFNTHRCRRIERDVTTTYYPNPNPNPNPNHKKGIKFRAQNLNLNPLITTREKRRWIAA